MTVVPNPAVQAAPRGKALRSIPDLECWTSE